MSRTSHSTQRAGAPVASAGAAARSSIRGLKSTPTTSSAPRFHSESVSRPPAHWRWIARRQRPRRSPIRSSSTREQARAPGPDQRHRLLEPALVSLGGLVPGGPVGGVHRADIRGLARAWRGGRCACLRVRSSGGVYRRRRCRSPTRIRGPSPSGRRPSSHVVSGPARSCRPRGPGGRGSIPRPRAPAGAWCRSRCSRRGGRVAVFEAPRDASSLAVSRRSTCMRRREPGQKAVRIAILGEPPGTFPAGRGVEDFIIAREATPRPGPETGGRLVPEVTHEHRVQSLLRRLLAESPPPARGILSQTLYDGDDVRLVMFGFAPGEELSEHTAARTAIVHVLAGEGRGRRRRGAAPGRSRNLVPHARPHARTRSGRPPRSRWPCTSWRRPDRVPPRTAS